MIDLPTKMVSRSTTFIDVISGRRAGWPYDLIRGCLMMMSLPYRLVIALRNAYYNRVGFSRRKVPCPVIAIGNITVGGTGKTPVAAHITGLLIERGLRAAVLTRGYKSSVDPLDEDDRDAAFRRWRTESDEALVLKRRCPHALIITNPNRLAGARQAIAEKANVLILDDGFQHRRLARDLDIVLIDATQPFGHDHLLPRGLLREPPKSLRRADLLLLTRSDQIDESDKRLLTVRLKRESGGKPLIQTTHRITGFMDVKGRRVCVEDPGAMRAVIFAGIANFNGFRHNVEGLGIRVVAAYQYPDHHAYTSEELEALQDVAETLEANVILTTEKDAVKLVGRWNDSPCMLMVLDLKIEFDADGAKILSDALDRVLEQQPICDG